MLLSTLLSVMLRVLRVLARIVLSVTLCYLILCSQCLSRWFYKKLIILFHNGDIIPVGAFLYLFIVLNRVILTYTRRSTNKTVTVLLASPYFFPRTRQGHI